MTFSEPPRSASRRTRWTLLAAFAVVCAASIGVLEHQSADDSPSAASSTSAATSSGPSSPVGPPIVAAPLTHRARTSLPELPDTSAGLADGLVPDEVTVFDDSVPAVSKLNPALLRALRQAATA